MAIVVMDVFEIVLILSTRAKFLRLGQRCAILRIVFEERFPLERIIDSRLVFDFLIILPTTVLLEAVKPLKVICLRLQKISILVGCLYL